eukprot:7986908-Pyramimonas_sp.AAC.2
MRRRRRSRMMRRMRRMRMRRRRRSRRRRRGGRREGSGSERGVRSHEYRVTRSAVPRTFARDQGRNAHGPDGPLHRPCALLFHLPLPFHTL